MSGMQAAVFIFFGLLVIATIIYAFYMVNKSAKAAKESVRERDELKYLYDQLRKEKLDFEDKINQAQSQERTYKAAYEDWKSKYVLLEEKHLNLKREVDSGSMNSETTVLFQNELREKEILINELKQQIAKLESKPQTQSSSDSKIVSDLKAVLDQHLSIISQIIGDEKMEQYTQKSSPADPLHLIKGIDDKISTTLQSHGVRTFEQISKTPKKDLRKWMIEFDDVDDKLIESWPFQAEAIMNVLAADKAEGV
ncbi:MAG: hypothetical protein IPM34_06420 [Saprospiraceae bacterium]|nr:hypothetical protein [Saprospiraceae bacterium]